MSQNEEEGSCSPKTRLGLNGKRRKRCEWPRHRRPSTHGTVPPDKHTLAHLSPPRSLLTGHTRQDGLYNTVILAVSEQSAGLLPRFNAQLHSLWLLHGKSEASDPIMPMRILTRHTDFRKQWRISGERQWLHLPDNDRHYSTLEPTKRERSQQREPLHNKTTLKAKHGLCSVTGGRSYFSVHMKGLTTAASV
ncbi:hypothetical protein MHYP_G00180540 [Metynnis hypsauchen]